VHSTTEHTVASLIDEERKQRAWLLHDELVRQLMQELSGILAM